MNRRDGLTEIDHRSDDTWRRHLNGLSAAPSDAAVRYVFTAAALASIIGVAIAAYALIAG
jgi:hypothetical protein